jgi:MFS family permease
LLSGLVAGLLSGLVVGLFIGLTSRVDATIQPAEVVVWSWRKLIETKSIKGRLRVGISSGLILGLLIGLLVTATSPTHYLPLILFAVVAVAMIVVVMVAVVGVTASMTSGISTKLQRVQRFTTPNQGMRRSLQNSIRIAIVGFIIGGTISVLAFSFLLILIKAEIAGGLVIFICLFLFFWSLGGTISGLIVALPNGGIAIIQHAVLRLLLWHKKYIPWNYSRFLDYAVERVFLRKVGGGFIFIHRLLLDYFASINTS